MTDDEIDDYAREQFETAMTFGVDLDLFRRTIRTAVKRTRKSSDEWIPCSERMPEEGESVLCALSEVMGDGIVAVAARTAKDYWYCDSLLAITIANVTHWRPLPATPDAA